MKKKKLIIILLSLGVIAIALSTIIFLNKDRTPRIFEIKGTEKMWGAEKDGIIIEKYYMVENHPKNLEDLQVLVEQYYEDNYKEIEAVCKDVNNPKYYHLFFFRSSKKTPKKWHPRNNYFFTDEIDSHKGDCISTLYYSNLDAEKRYSFYIKNNYGKTNREKSYTKIIETDLYEGEREVENNFSYWDFYNSNYVN